MSGTGNEISENFKIISSGRRQYPHFGMKDREAVLSSHDEVDVDTEPYVSGLFSLS